MPYFIAILNKETLLFELSAHNHQRFMSPFRLIVSFMLFHHAVLLFCYNGANERTIEVRHFHIIIKNTRDMHASTPMFRDRPLPLIFYSDKSNHN